MLVHDSSRVSSWLRRLFAGRCAAVQTRSTCFRPEVLEDRTLLSGTTLLVQLNPGAESSVFTASSIRNVIGDGIVHATRIDGLFRVHVDDACAVEVANSLRGNPSVAYAETQSVLRVQLTPNDPNFTNGVLFGLDGAFGIDAPTAWDSTTGTTTPVVAVIDTGVDYRHGDLYRNIWLNQAEIPSSVRTAIQSDPSWDIDGDGLITFWDLNDPRNQGVGKISDFDGDGRITGADVLRTTASGGWADGIDNNTDGYRDDLIGWDFINNDNNPLDDHYHGTHVAGTIGAIGDNGVGVVGVNWKVQIMGLKFLGSDGNGNDANAAMAIRYAANHGSQISNNSWGGGSFSNTLNSAIAYAAGLDHLFVAAAGNAGVNTDVNANYPSNYNQPNILSVAATTNNGALASFSNFGQTTVDVGAPGQNIYSTLPGNSYGYLSGTSMAAPHVAGAAALLLARNPALTYADLKDRLLSTTTPLTSLAGKTVSGGLLNIANAIQDGPEISVLDGVISLLDGTSTANFGSTFTGAPVSKTFTVRNVGNQTLTLSDAISIPVGYTLTSGFSTLSLAPGAATNFTVRLDANTSGTFTGAISFGSSDVNENPFDFSVTGTATNVRIIDNGDAGFSTIGGWTAFSNQGYQNDIHYSAAGSGSGVATWTFAVAPGNYRVSATWFAHSNRATDSPFTVQDGNVALATVRLNQELVPNDFNHSGVDWENIGGSYAITGNSLVVKLANNANEYVIADAIRIERLGSIPVGPEIQVLDGGTDLVDGTATVVFGNTAPGVPISKTFTVMNTGTQNLALGAISVPTGYTVTNGLGATTLAPSSSTTFTVRLDAATVGNFNGQISLVNTDADENPFNFSVQGTVAAAPVVQIIDNGDTGFTTVGAWSSLGGQGFQNDIHYIAAGSGSDVATWTFSVAPGIYRVSATWNAFTNRATDSPFSVLDGVTPVGSIRLNQQLAPNDFTDAGVGWEDLGSGFAVTGGSLVVKLANNANQYVIADGMRIERLGDIPNGPEIQVLDGAIDLTFGSAVVNFGNTAPGAPILKTFTVKNVGTEDLTLNNISLPTGFSLFADFGNHTLTAGTSTTFTVRFDAASVGTFNGQVSIGNNDVNESPFQFNIQGSAAAIPTVQILDNGDVGFSTVGSWTPFANQGYQNDIHYSAAAGGLDFATWTFAVAPGTYRVSATWFAHSNRATDSPFTVLDGSNPLATVRLNQELAPDDFTDAGIGWENIGGTFTITGTSLVVRLTNNANEYVIADAIRIERIA